MKVSIPEFIRNAEREVQASLGGSDVDVEACESVLARVPGALRERVVPEVVGLIGQARAEADSFATVTELWPDRLDDKEFLADVGAALILMARDRLLRVEVEGHPVTWRFRFTPEFASRVLNAEGVRQ